MKKNMMVGLMCGWGALSGLGAEWYVDGARPDDSGDGTGWGTAKRTIQAAVDLANTGDTVTVAPGVYGDGTRVTPGGRLRNRVVVTKEITLQSRDGAEKTVILGACDPADLSNGGCGPEAVRCVFMDRGVLKGFTLAGGATGSENKEDLNNRGGGLYSSSPNGLPLVYGCIVSNNAAIRGGGAYGGAFRRCRITRNRATQNGAGVRDSKLHDCLVVFNEGAGASFCYARSGGRDNGLFNCTVAYNTGTGLDQCSAFNTVSVCNGEAFRLSSAIPSLTFVNCCLSSPTVLGSNNIVAAYARFADAVGGDFRLLENSPCLDAGSPAFLSRASGAAGLTDFLGAPRVQGKAVDIGAVEGVVAGVAAVAVDPPQGEGAVSPGQTLVVKNLP
ncbi:MAG: choice-of-anchor Q domain-containing protein, partial [Kiritimatiellae bacterium]|nr:choice-of-anchor Q domain-containing protein [Kiritimatiellia bacterium]